jgi:hypothetical protein
MKALSVKESVIAGTREEVPAIRAFVTDSGVPDGSFENALPFQLFHLGLR